MGRIALFVATATFAMAAVLALLWAAQRRLIYFPFGGLVPHPAEAGLDASEVLVKTGDGLALGAWFVEPAPPGSGWTLILFNGNAGNRALRAPLARRLAERGISILMLDYRGYGGNPGTPSETGLLRDARAARRWVAERTSGGPTRIAYLGESLGTGVAVALAAENQPDALILRSPYTSLVDLAAFHYPLVPARWLLRDRYQSIDRIGALSCPILIIAAERDSVVPVSQSRRLFEAAPPASRHWVLLPGADHNDDETLAGDAVIDEMVAFLAGVAKH